MSRPSELRYIAVHQLGQSFRLLLLLQKVMMYSRPSNVAQHCRL